MIDTHRANFNYRHRWSLYVTEEDTEQNIVLECLDCDLYYKNHEIIEIVARYHDLKR